MPGITLSPPGRWRGSAEEQLEQCYSYLFQMRQQPQLALEQTVEAAPAPRAAPSEPEKPAVEAPAVNALRALILQSAKLVRKEMDKLSTELRGSFVAASDFGAYLEQINSRIEADPTAITQYYKFISEIQGNLDAVSAGFERYRLSTEGYIRTGIVSREDSGAPIYGVAVGQGLTSREVDGETVIDSTQFRSVFTAQRLSFYQGDAEVAYLSDRKLYVENVTVLGALELGPWQLSGSSGFSLKWTGGQG